MLDLTRRDFMKTTGAALGAATLPAAGVAAQPAAAADAAAELRVLAIGVEGIGRLDRTQVAEHPRARIVGLCDVDRNRLEKAKGEHPDVFTDTDYRRIFADRADEFDAVIVATPDHHHVPMMLTALAHDKHCYGQKPLVQQLAELPMIEQAIAAKPHLATQTGNQRMKEPGRRAAVEILRRNQLGPAIEAYVWTASSRGKVVEPPMPAVKDVPAHLDWDLWLGPCPPAPYRETMAHQLWREWWEYGTGALGDWGVHLLDIIFYSYPELTSPAAVLTHSPRAASWMHTSHCQSTLTYEVDSDRFKNKQFPIHYRDVAQAHSLTALGIPAEKWPATNMTVVVCEGGVLALTAGGGIEIWRDGQMTKGWNMPDIPRPRPFNHWHVWVDQALGDQDAEVWTPFSDGVRITEPAVMAVKASRFPGKELLWDRASLTFTNHQEATDTIVRRTYRDGFAPPSFDAAS